MRKQRLVVRKELQIVKDRELIFNEDYNDDSPTPHSPVTDAHSPIPHASGHGK